MFDLVEEFLVETDYIEPLALLTNSLQTVDEPLSIQEKLIGLACNGGKLIKIWDFGRESLHV